MTLEHGRPFSPVCLVIKSPPIICSARSRASSAEHLGLDDAVSRWEGLGNFVRLLGRLGHVRFRRLHPILLEESKGEVFVDRKSPLRGSGDSPNEHFLLDNRNRTQKWDESPC